LINEGIAREFINRIQNLRKELDFEVTDKIKVYYSGNENITKAIENKSDYIKNEILATELILSDNKTEMTEIDINDINIKAKIEKI
jgi:isoleucyl-tRNA synthetase